MKAFERIDGYVYYKATMFCLYMNKILKKGC
jgi:hypothetical protein